MDDDSIACARFSTEGLAPVDVMGAWRERVGGLFDLEMVDGEDGACFRAEIETFRLPSILLSRSRLGAQRYRRDARLVRDGCDHVVVALYQAGDWRGEAAGETIAGSPGQILIVDLAQPLVCETTAARVTSLVLPREPLAERWLRLDQSHGRSPVGPLSALLADFIDILSRHAPTMKGAGNADLAHAVSDMLVACLAPCGEALERARPAIDALLLTRARRLVDANLSSPRVDVALLCRALGTSRRSLYRLFEPSGGVQHYIQGRRLDRIRAHLADPGETRRIAEIAVEFGFVRGDHFARAFKQRFGFSARDARHAPQPRRRPAESTAEATPHAADGIAQWIRDLERW